MPEKDRKIFREAWLERLINAAVAAGAKAPPQGVKRKAQEEPTASAGPSTKKSNPHIIDVDAEEDIPVTITSRSLPPTIPSTSSSHLPPGPIACSSHNTPIGNPKQSTLQFARATKEDKSESSCSRTRNDKLKRKKEREREQGRERQQRKRARDRENTHKDVPDKRNATKVLMNGAAAIAGTSATRDVADVSRPATQAWKKSRNGTQGGVMNNVPSKRVFWFHPFLWALIVAAVIRNDWSAGAAVKDLHRSHPQLFDARGSTLHRGTLWKWLVKGEQKFTDHVLKNVLNRRTLIGSGRVGVLAAYPEVSEEIVRTLRGLRTAGCVVNIPIARSLMIALIRKHNPAILDTFKCSEKFVRSFLESVLDWSSRKATRAAKHIPENAGELCERTFFRLVHAIESEHIPASLVINYDQTGNYILPNGSSTFEQRGAKQVAVTAKDEKRAYTIGMATSAGGQPLPTEQIWSGKSKLSLPKETADGYAQAKVYGFRFSFAASEKKTSHFSTQSTMQDWVTFVLVPYMKDVIEADPDLDEEQKAILYIDIYPVYTSQEFRQFVFKLGNDVGLQRLAKHKLKQSMLEYLVRCYDEQIAAGITSDKVVFSSSYPVLRDASVRACVDLYAWLESLDGKTVIKRSWEKCVVPGKPEYNLSYECLTSRESRKALRAYLKKDPTLANEIRDRCDATHLDRLPLDLPDDPEHGPESNLDKDLDDNQDDSDVPLINVLRDTLGDGLNAPPTALPVTSTAARETESEGMSATNVEEDIWAFDDQGRKWADIEALKVDRVSETAEEEEAEAEDT
ncbi:hypothetical protein C8R47DRAFT_1084330 [Mycena vitilis]|nr:hypothetical protein C8R47DRAFT_1084330 [Mycena vitilis]